MTAMPDGLARLEARIQRDLAMIDYPEPQWVRPRPGAKDVVIVGAGQGGLVAAFALLRERVSNILVIDKAPPGREGPWRNYARMLTLRSPKATTGPDLGIPSLTYQAWHEAQWGEADYAALNKIPTGNWADYLQWYRRVLGIPVHNNTELERIEPQADGLLRLQLSGGRSLVTRKLVIATGIEGAGRWWMPEMVERLPEHLRAHSCDPIDYAALKGKCIAVLGAGASAFDNTATALEAGAARVDLYCRAERIKRLQPFRWMSNNGFMRHIHTLDDAWRWRFLSFILELREAFPRETWERVIRHPNFRLHEGSPWERLEVAGERVRIATPKGEHAADFLVAATGMDVNLGLIPPLAPFADLIALWADRYAPPPVERNERLARYPYLGPGLALTEKVPGAAPFLRNIHLFNWGSTMSFGPSGASINGMKFAIPKLVTGITGDLYTADLDAEWASLQAYDTPEFEITEAQRRSALATD
jgi:cation diffusion facilitator CzcD-associated flavoprotein CzcO